MFEEDLSPYLVGAACWFPGADASDEEVEKRWQN
jgi:hypothetical protein